MLPSKQDSASAPRNPRYIALPIPRPGAVFRRTRRCYVTESTGIKKRAASAGGTGRLTK